MRPTLLEHLRCPQCSQRLSIVSEDELQCSGCRQAVPIVAGAPRFTGDVSDTAVYFGYMWGQQEHVVQPPDRVLPYHLAPMREALGAPPLRGLVLDAGCGDGVDLAMLALDPQCEVIGVDLSSGGVATSLARTKGLERAHVVQGDLLRIPLASDTFDAAYSYGVVHHTPDPQRAVQEIARTLKPGGALLLYVYEDFADRPWHWRAALALANSPRWLTTRLPPSLVMGLSKLLSPIVYVLCTLPSRHFSWAARFPYRHGTHPLGLSGDLYDRFSAPIEERYSRDGAAALAAAAGLDVLNVVQMRGWTVHAKKPVRAPEELRTKN